MKPLTDLIPFLTSYPMLTWGLFFALITLLVLVLIRVGVWCWWQQPYSRLGELKFNLNSPFFVRITLTLFALGLVFVMVFILHLSWWIITGFVFGLGLVFVGLKLSRAKKERTDLQTQIPLLLRSLGSTLKAGYSVPQALAFVAEESQNPIRAKLKTGVRMLLLQQPLEMVLIDWQQKLKCAEFDFLADSLRLQARSGGNLIELCYSVASLLEERRKLEQDIKSFTAQGKMSGVLMAALWPISLLLFAWLSPSHTDVLFSSTPGRILLGLSLTLELVGFLLIWRLVRLKI